MDKSKRGFMHMSVSNRWLIGFVEAYGNPPEAPIVTHDDGTPATKEETLEQLRQYPPEHLWPADGCDHFDPEEGCLGH